MAPQALRKGKLDVSLLRSDSSSIGVGEMNALHAARPSRNWSSVISRRVSTKDANCCAVS
jgi:hypothetical protein